MVKDIVIGLMLPTHSYYNIDQASLITSRYGSPDITVLRYGSPEVYAHDSFEVW